MSEINPFKVTDAIKQGKVREKRGLNLRFRIVLPVLILYLGASSVLFAVELVVNKSVPIDQCTISDVRAIFTTKRREWPNGKPIRTFKLADDHPLHKEFAKNILLMLPHQIRQIWDRITFSGTGTAPAEVASEQEMREKIADIPDSVGYLDSDPKNENIRVLNINSD